MKTTLAKTDTAAQQWYIIDASKEVLGRLAVKVAAILRGRNKPIYTPHADAGDFVIVINAEKINVTGKKEVQKDYMFYNQFVGRERRLSLGEMRARNKGPEFIILHAVKGMLPKSRLADRLLTKLKVYAGPDHPHAAQNPKPLN
jgi:large subunit ribosomal protein L13